LGELYRLVCKGGRSWELVQALDAEAAVAALKRITAWLRDDYGDNYLAALRDALPVAMPDEMSMFIQQFIDILAETEESDDTNRRD